MKKIFKYPLETTDEQAIPMPDAAKILTVQVQRGKPYVWAEVLVEQSLMTMRRFFVFGTGNPLPTHFDQLHYVGTYQLMDGKFVGHVYVDRVS